MVESRSRMGKSSLDGNGYTRIDFDSTCEFVKICVESVARSSMKIQALELSAHASMCSMPQLHRIHVARPLARQFILGLAV